MRIAITGIGIVSAIGCNCAETLQALLEQRSGIAPMRYLHSVHTEYPVGEVKLSNDELRQRLGLGNEPIPRTSLLGIMAAREAILMSQAPYDTFISGTTVGGMDLTEQHWNDYHNGKSVNTIPLHEAGETTKAILYHLPNDQINEQMVNDPYGEANCMNEVNKEMVNVITPSTACSSALNAIMLGCDMLRTGQAKRAIVGGAESLSLFHFNGFRTLMIMDRQPCRPFDANRNGLNLGEGAGYLVIENEADAIARGAKILGYIGGYANACDAFHQTASSPEGEGAYLAMKGALDMAGLQPSDIDYINAHGTATPNNDASESASVTRLFGVCKLPAISSTKAFTGHTTSASGGIEAAICVLAMNHGFIPANLRWQQSAEGLIAPVTQTRHQPLHHVLCNAFGFGGNDSSLLLSDHAIDLSEATLEEPRSLQMVNEPYGEADRMNEVNKEMVNGQMVSAAEARRMTPQMRQLVSAARQALQDAEIEQPDAIVCATQWGCMLQSMRFLQDMIDTHEKELKPTPFIQSTHNTVASLMAILTNNHGYNATYSQGKQSLACAMTDIRSQMALGRIHSALVLEFDEQVDAWDEVLALIGERTHNVARAHVYLK